MAALLLGLAIFGGGTILVLCLGAWFEFIANPEDRKWYTWVGFMIMNLVFLSLLLAASYALGRSILECSGGMCY